MAHWQLFAVMFHPNESDRQQILVAYFKLLENEADERRERVLTELGGEGKGTLLTLIGGPDAGRVEWHPSVTSAAAEPGLSRNEAGDLEVTA